MLGVEEIIERTLQEFSKIKKTYDNRTDSTYPSVLITTEPIRKAYIQFKNRGVKVRFITEITNDNLLYSKELLGIINDIRHLDGVKGNLAIGDGVIYAATATVQTTQPIEQLVVSTVRALVQQQQYFFDMLWHKAVPAKQRIKEIEEHTTRQFLDTIQDGLEINDLVHSLAKSAREEILMMFPTTNTFYRYEKAGLFKSIKEATIVSGINVRIMVHSDNQKIRDRISQEYAQVEHFRIFILQMPKLQSKVISMIVDNEYSLAIELKDDRAVTSTDAIGFATYSNSESTVTTYTSIFETLWMQGEIQELK